ncbi:hypothetical protein MRX96_043249 [Rhipicephalus microplus]
MHGSPALKGHEGRQPKRNLAQAWLPSLLCLLPRGTAEKRSATDTVGSQDSTSRHNGPVSDVGVEASGVASPAFLLDRDVRALGPSQSGRTLSSAAQAAAAGASLLGQRARRARRDGPFVWQRRHYRSRDSAASLRAFLSFLRARLRQRQVAKKKALCAPGKPARKAAFVSARADAANTKSAS